MRWHRKVERMTVIAGLVLLLMSVQACTGESPTGPEIDPLCGKWIGTMVDPFTSETKAESFTLTILAGGIANGTGYLWYDIGYNTVIMALFFEGEIQPDGSITGEGRLLYVIVGAAGIYGEGTVTESLDVGSFTGTGKLTALFQDGMLEIEWEVEKEGVP